MVDQTIQELQDRAYDIRPSVEYINGQLRIILILSYLNLMFLFSQVTKIIFLKKVGRSTNFPNFGFFTDLILAIASFILIRWLQLNVLMVDQPPQKFIIPHDPKDDEYFRVLAIFQQEITFGMEYMMTIMIVCLVFKVVEYIQFTENIGPLVKIVGKMFGDYSNFFILYTILVVMFTIVGNMNFIVEQGEFKTFLASCLFVLDASIGNYNF